MTHEHDPESLHRFLIARQPILDAHQVLIGYELLFRDSVAGTSQGLAPGVATADVVCKVFADLGLGKALAGHKAFVIVDREFLNEEAIDALPADGLVIEVSAELVVDAAVAARCRDLIGRGYSFCLLNVGDLGTIDPALLQQVTFIKQNLNACDEGVLRQLQALPLEHRPLAIASHVETHADHDRAQALGFQFFQGYFFAEPVLIEGRRLDSSLQGLMRILHLLNEDAELTRIESAFKAEPALTVKLLRLTNSAGIGLRVRIGSVRQAINLIGRRHIARWLQLLLFSQNAGDSIAQNPLMQLAALRGSFMERLARRAFSQQAMLVDLAFLAGLMSQMPAALGMAMADILDQLAVAPQLRQALLQRQGDLGVLLALTDAYDNDESATVDSLLLQLGQRIGRETLNQCLVESIAWVQELAADSD